MSFDLPHPRRLLLGAGAGALLLAALAALLLPLSHVATQFPSIDGYVYLVIARNAPLGWPSSFDGIHLTNGYHPLWALLLTGVAGLVTKAALADSSEGLLRGGLLLCCLLNGSSAWVLHATLRRLAGPALAVLGVCLFVLAVVPASFYLSEAPLSILCFAVFLWQIVSDWGGAGGSAAGKDQRRGRHAAAAGDDPDDRGPRQPVLCGALAALVVLSRLDLWLVIVPVLLPGPVRLARRAVARVVLSRLPPRQRLALLSALLPALVCAVLLLPYLVTNACLYGHLLPIGGGLLSRFPHPRLTGGSLSPGCWVGVLLPVVAAGLFLLTSPARPAAAMALLRGASLGVLPFVAYQLLFQEPADWGRFSRHLAVPTYLAALLIPLLLSLHLRRQQAVNLLCLLILQGGFAAIHYKLWRQDHPDFALLDAYETGQWIHDSLGPEDVVAATDSRGTAGMVAYYGQHHTLDLDRLPRDSAASLAAYLEDSNVTYLCLRSGLRPGASLGLLAGPAGTAGPVGPARYRSPGRTFAIWRWPVVNSNQ